MTKAAPSSVGIELLFEAVRAVNDLADVLRADGWELDFGCGTDYIAASAAKQQKGKGPTMGYERPLLRAVK